ncbi:DUF4011 domain-containing protein [Mycoplasma sp. ES3225-GEN-MYC]|uniref:AAA domain-containing protein n=1 Tax=Mycoplasma miroungigenitalium TaxID=754515 RepID=UPI001C12791A|nr:AAA domain-containing protein [Mycoplasma miroungigenitalium]MBU4691531.1 DUF4011 domain-containing protein [Mycoplasma miroungigenitalium]
MSNKASQNIETWKNDLLDLTYRNKALNYSLKTSKTQSKLEVICPDLKTILDYVGSEKIEIANLSFDSEFNEQQKNLKIVKLDDVIDKIGACKPNTLYSNVDYEDQAIILKKINKKYLDFIDQYSINTLFLSFGLLKWSEAENNTSISGFVYSPLMFLQANLKSKNLKNQTQYHVLFDDEFTLTPNLALIRKLSVIYGINIDINAIDNCENNYAKYNNFVEQLTTNFRSNDWQIDNRIFLDTFSFSKINMYVDLDENEDKIVENEFIKALSNEENDGINDFDIINEDNVETKININEYYHVLDSDSSQEVAIQSAIQGESFILQGPPGTGKSHTITNIITELLARNKKVLFVSEKKAALDVVYNNLKKIQLNDYVIPIHSLDLDKKAILKDLDDTLEKGKLNYQVASDPISKFTNDYLAIVERLKKYGWELLKLRAPLNKSLYKMIGNFYKFDKVSNLQFNINNFLNIDSEKLDELKINIKELQDYINHFDKNPILNVWWGLKLTRLSEIEKENFFSLIEIIGRNIDVVYSDLTNNHKFITFNDVSYIKNIKFLFELFTHLMCIQGKIDTSVFQINNYDNEIAQYSNMTLNLEQKIKLLEKNKNIFRESIISENILEFETIFNKYHNKSYRFLVSKWHKAKKIIKKHFLTKDKSVIENVLPDLIELKRCENNFWSSYNNSNFKPKNKNLQYLQSIYKMIVFASKTKLFSAISDFSIDIQKMVYIFNEDIRYRNELLNSLNKLKKFQDDFKRISDVFDENIANFDSLSKNDLKIKLSQFAVYKDDFTSMLSLVSSINNIKKYSLDDFVEKVLNGNYRKNLFEIFMKRFYKILIDHFINECFVDFNGSKLETLRDNFINVEANVQQLARAKIIANLNNNIPNASGLGSKNLEVKILKSEVNKSRNRMSFKKLFEKIPNLMLQLKPCLMMSPLSVSAYLKDSDILFDTVIFDEASQVRPETAIGAISRAKQVIIVGDSEQLPPTNFFNTIDQNDYIDVDDENDISVKGFDSILDMSNIVLKTIKLRWHYRSLYENLIYPSNKEIYHDLITFPSLTEPGKYESINKIKVEGVLVDRKNEVEADKTVEIIKDIIDTYGSNVTLGVVTFNTEQQLLLERKIEKFKQSNPMYSSFFDRDKEDPFFVKNIETVQGDEREFVIINSVYGPDENDKISMRFGPINHDNGYKRLNVAFTRAKRGIVIITSLDASDIDLNRTDSRGVKFLKKYLEIAEYGIDKTVDYVNDFNSFDSPFEEEVYRELTNAGYKLKTQVGCSGFRIDLAVVDPTNPNRFILGIECDGATYHSSKTSRDRDRLRQQVLNGRGWHIHRIWSTSWFTNKKAELNAILKKLSDIKNGKDYTYNILSKNSEIASNSYLNVTEKQNLELNFDVLPEFNNEQIAGIVRNYHISNFASSIDLSHTLIRIVKDLLVKYQVIHSSIVKRILTFLCNRQSFTSFVKRFYDSFLRYSSDIAHLNGEFFIHPNLSYENIIFKKGETQRSRETVHYYEYVHLVKTILQMVKSIEKDSLIRIINEQLGYKSLNSKNKEYFNKTLEDLVDNNIITNQDDVYQLN